ADRGCHRRRPRHPRRARGARRLARLRHDARWASARGIHAHRRRTRCLHRPGRAGGAHRADRYSDPRHLARGPRMTAIWGILNATPDSFSDGGRYTEPGKALAQAHLMRSQGAAVIDVGGESTRPGAVRVARSVEQARVLPIIEALADAGIPVSVDTLNAD